jgi:hypothetical protein
MSFTNHIEFLREKKELKGYYNLKFGIYFSSVDIRSETHAYMCTQTYTYHSHSIYSLCRFNGNNVYNLTRTFVLSTNQGYKNK